MRGKLSSEDKAEITIGVVAATILSIIFWACVMFFPQSCATYVRTPALIPTGINIDKLNVDYQIDTREGDEKQVMVTVGSMRKALITAEKYEYAVGVQNDTVDFANTLADGLRHNAEESELNTKVGIYNTVLAAVGGSLGGFLLAYFILNLIGG